MRRLGDRERVALRRGGYSPEEVAELEADVVAGNFKVELVAGEARVVAPHKLPRRGRRRTQARRRQ